MPSSRRRKRPSRTRAVRRSLDVARISPAESTADGRVQRRTTTRKACFLFLDKVPAPIHESRFRLGDLLKTKRSGGLRTRRIGMKLFRRSPNFFIAGLLILWE